MCYINYRTRILKPFSPKANQTIQTRITVFMTSSTKNITTLLNPWRLESDYLLNLLHFQTQGSYLASLAQDNNVFPVDWSYSFLLCNKKFNIGRWLILPINYNGKNYLKKKTKIIVIHSQTINLLTHSFPRNV